MQYVFALKKYVNAVFLYWYRMLIWSNTPTQAGSAGARSMGTFECLQDRTLHNLYQQPDPLLRQSVSRLKGSPPVFQCVPFASCPATVHH